eukprot:9467852-Pyramimonas_sp.AAC.1
MWVTRRGVCQCRSYLGLPLSATGRPRLRLAHSTATSDRDGRRGAARPRGWHQRRVRRPGYRDS